MTLKQHDKEIRSAAKSSYEFIQQCFHLGLCTFEEAKKAQDSVHKDCLRDLEILYNFMKERELEAREV